MTRAELNMLRKSVLPTMKKKLTSLSKSEADLFLSPKECFSLSSSPLCSASSFLFTSTFRVSAGLLENEELDNRGIFDVISPCLNFNSSFVAS